MKFNLLAIVIIFFEAMVHLNFCEVAEADIRRMKVRLRTEDAPAGSNLHLAEILPRILHLYRKPDALHVQQ